MHPILIYGDSLTWGIIPNTRQRLPFHQRWPGVLENALLAVGRNVRILEDCLNGRRTVWEDPFKPGRNGVHGLAQRMEIHSPLSLVILMLGTNDFQFSHPYNTAWTAGQGIATLVHEIRRAPIEPGMPMPPILVIAPPPIRSAPMSGSFLSGSFQRPVALKFANAEAQSQGLADAYQEVCATLHCHFFDAATVTPSSAADGVHLDADQHLLLGKALESVVSHILAAKIEERNANTPQLPVSQ